MKTPDYIVRVSGIMPDGSVVDQKFERMDDALELSRRMTIVTIAHLKTIVLKGPVTQR